MKSETRMRLTSMAAAMGMTFGRMFGNGSARIVCKNMRPLGWSRPHQGAQEIARRARQIAKGQLTKSNGLVS